MGGEHSPGNVDAQGNLEKRLAAFEVAWSAAERPSIADYLGSDAMLSAPQQRQLVLELVAIDMEYRCRTGEECPGPGGRVADDMGGRPKTPAYAKHVTQLGSVAELPGWILAEEYRVRRLWGDAPNTDQFIAEYPDQVGELVELIPLVERELVADAAVPCPRERFSPIDEIDPRAPLPFTDYRLEKHLGSGAMGKVYRATQLSLGRPVAIKALLKSRQQDQGAIEQFLHEARLVAQLSHANILGVHGLGRFPHGGFFQVIHFVEGQDLAARLQATTLTIAEAVRIASAAAAAIEHAHEHGIVHCDLKPANVLLGPGGHVFVSDFGFAQLVTAPAAQIANPWKHRVGGTVGYMAPEQIDPSLGEITTAVDIYGLGALFYSLLTNERPAQPGLDTMIRGQPTQTIEPVGQLRVEISQELEAICMRCLRLDPTVRYASAAEFADALRHWSSNPCGSPDSLPG